MDHSARQISRGRRGQSWVSYTALVHPQPRNRVSQVRGAPLDSTFVMSTHDSPTGGMAVRRLQYAIRNILSRWLYT